VATTGWYNDESDPALARWYDGEGWTDHVTVKANWEALGHAPPPPEDWPDGSYVPGLPDRRRAVAAAAVAVVVLAIGGVALARDGGDGAPPRAPTHGQSDPVSHLGDATGAGIDAPAADAGVVGSDPATVGASSTGGGGTSSSSRRTSSTSAGGVRHTETATQSHSNTGPVSSPGGGSTEDKTSVGNTNDQTIRNDYVPPPPTTATTEAATTTTPTTDETATTVEDTSTTAP
jgi:hypothetical protein